MAKERRLGGISSRRWGLAGAEVLGKDFQANRESFLGEINETEGGKRSSILYITEADDQGFKGRRPIPRGRVARVRSM